MAIKNTSELRVMLLDAIEQVKSGTMEPKQAHAIGNLSAKVIQSAKLDLDVLRFNLLSGSASLAGEKVLQLVSG